MKLLVNMMFFGGCQGIGLATILLIHSRTKKRTKSSFIHIIFLISIFLILHYLYFSGIVNNHRVIIICVTLTILLIQERLVRYFLSSTIGELRMLSTIIRISIVVFFILTILFQFLEYVNVLLIDGRYWNYYFEIVQLAALFWLVILISRVFLFIRRNIRFVGTHIFYVFLFFLIYVVAWIIVLTIQYSDLDLTNDYVYAVYFQLVPFAGIYLIGYYFILNKYSHLTEPDLIHNSTSECINVIKAALIENELYLDPNLSLRDLSSAVAMSPRKLSKILKDELSMGFYDLINYYRLDHFIKTVESNKHLKFEAVATLSGFNNKTTFYKAFKKRFNTTPGKFISS